MVRLLFDRRFSTASQLTQMVKSSIIVWSFTLKKMTEFNAYRLALLD